jgi:RNA polymerase sigma-70 factor (TIGR02957 family)
LTDKRTQGAKVSQDHRTEVFQTHHGLLVTAAYQMLGSAADAEDVVQETWLRWDRADRSEVSNERAYLVQITARLALDRLRRVKARREDYVGPWLPEPLLTSPDVAEDVELAESVSMAMLVVLETLSPLERVVFVLRETFGFSHAEIAHMLGRSEEAVRQLARRAREHVRERRPRFHPDRDLRQRVTERFLAASLGGDLEELLRVLAPDVTLWGDGGGKATAPPRPIHGADKVARFLVGAMARQPLTIRVVSLNGGPAGLVSADGSLAAVLIVDLDSAGERVETIWAVGNPDKLVRLPASDEQGEQAG